MFPTVRLRHLVCAFVVSCASLTWAAEQSPPSSLTLIYPSDGISTNQNVTVGFVLDDPTVDSGFSSNVSVSLQYPNGTTSLLGSVRECGPGLGGATFSVLDDQAGTYTAFWNVTYGVPVSGTNGSTNGSCSGQQSYQSWTLNATFGAQDTGGDGKVGGEVTTTSSLPSKPTGSTSGSQPTGGAKPNAALSVAIGSPGSAMTALVVFLALSVAW